MSDSGSLESTLRAQAAPLNSPSDLLTDSQLQKIRQEGFLVLQNISPDEEVTRVRQILERLFDRKAGEKEGAYFNFAGPDDNPDAPSAPQVIGPHNYAASLRKTEFYRTAAKMARQILGPEATFTSDHTLMKPAYTGAPTPWHQDEAFRDPGYTYNELSFWMPLQPVDERNGCMQFIPGTQLNDVLPHRSMNDDPKIHALECSGGYDPATMVSCPLPAGGCTIHTGRTLHGSPPNISDKIRYAYVLIFSSPPVAAPGARQFPWLMNKDTVRMKRMKSWLRQGGFVVEAWRLVKDTPASQLIPQFRRKAYLFLSLLWSKRSA